MGGFLVRKLVKPTKVLCSWPTHECGFGLFRPSKAQPDIRAAAAGVLRKANPAVRQELGGLDPTNRVLDQLAELKTLCVGDCCPKILNLDQSFPDEYNLGDFGNPGHPGIANQLRVQRQQSIRFFLVPAGRGLG
jgi:hypothetical protein